MCLPIHGLDPGCVQTQSRIRIGVSEIPDFPEGRNIPAMKGMSLAARAITAREARYKVSFKDKNKRLGRSAGPMETFFFLAEIASYISAGN